MKSQSISSRLLKAVMMGLVMAALLLSFRVSASAATKIYPYSTKTNILTKGYQYQLYYTAEYYKFNSTNPSVASVSQNGLITAKKKGTCRINVYFKSSGNYCNSFSFKVTDNRSVGESFKSIRVKKVGYGTQVLLSKASVKGRTLILNLVVANNRPYRMSKIKRIKFDFYIGGKKFYTKKIGARRFNVKKYGKKRLNLKFKLSKGTLKKMDLNYVTIYCYGNVYIVY